MAWAPSSCCCAHLQRVVPCLCCSCTTVSWGHSSSQHLLLPGSHGQHLPELCSPGGESSIISYEFSSLFLGNQFQRLILAHICTQQHPVKSTCGCCSFWRSWRSDSDSCQCPVLQSDISTGGTSQRKGFVLKSDSVPSSASYSIFSGLELGTFRSCWGVWAW